jgi:DNA-binding MarR family transcriptional regulator
LLERHSLERRVIDYLQDHYPVTARQLAAALGVPEKRIIMVLRRMESRGMVELDILPDATFIRCPVVRRKNERKKGGDGNDPAYS